MSRDECHHGSSSVNVPAGDSREPGGGAAATHRTVAGDRLAPVGGDVDDDPLEQLLADVRRIADGVGDMRRLVIECSARPVAPRIAVAAEPPNRAMREACDAYAQASNGNASHVTISRVTLLGLLVAAGAFGDVS
jgi:hypothetical protein